MDLPDDLPMNERIRLLRESRGMSRAVLAGLCGRGPDWLKKIESGERDLDSFTLLMRIAGALDVGDLTAITGPAPLVQPVRTGRLSHPAVPAIWSAVMERAMVPKQSGPVDVAALRGRVEQSWRLWHTSGHNRTEVGALLPDLIRDAEQAVRSTDGATRREANVVRSDVYRLVGQATAYVASPELAWLVADRAVDAARDADDPAAIGCAAWNLGNIMRETAYPGEALRIVVDAASQLRPHLDDGPEDWRGIYGALHLHAAVTSAREGKAGEAWRYWDTGNEVAKSLPQNYVHASTVFGRANVDFHAVSVATDLRSSSKALNLADDLDPDVMPSVERRSRLWVEITRGHLQRGDTTAALHVLTKAHRISPETVQFTPSARSAAAELWRKAPRALRGEAGHLAEAIDVTPPG
ncbi:helix-turn-helix domain-containing protein [Streptomyces sp. NPDC021093]|uniref:helix-turn-helix domain-containing protein n=1 Tax=Streptomyces sp. NPDC021093 TaxID=3365112 RepID=UPI0037874583